MEYTYKGIDTYIDVQPSPIEGYKYIITWVNELHDITDSHFNSNQVVDEHITDQVKKVIRDEIDRKIKGRFITEYEELEGVYTKFTTVTYPEDGYTNVVIKSNKDYFTFFGYGFKKVIRQAKETALTRIQKGITQSETILAAR